MSTLEEKIEDWIDNAYRTYQLPLSFMNIQNITKELVPNIQALITEAKTITENTSDGYHTFKELYEFRLLYNAALFNEWTAQGKYDVHKSMRHSDGKLAFGGGWFVVVAQLPTGQISNHYETKDFKLFKCEWRPDGAAEWDGHTPADVAIRLRALIEALPNSTTPKLVETDDAILDKNKELEEIERKIWDGMYDHMQEKGCDQVTNEVMADIKAVISQAVTQGKIEELKNITGKKGEFIEIKNDTFNAGWTTLLKRINDRIEELEDTN